MKLEKFKINFSYKEHAVGVSALDGSDSFLVSGDEKSQILILNLENDEFMKFRQPEQHTAIQAIKIKESKVRVAKILSDKKVFHSKFLF